MSEKQIQYSPIASTWYVSLKDILHEPLLTICLILSITSVLVPLMLLWSVKVGFIEELRSEFIADPSFREIRPMTAEIRKPELLDVFAKLTGVLYLVPSVMLVPREVTLQFQDKGRRQKVQAKLVPSSRGDPLHERLIGRFDYVDPDSVVLTSDIMEEHGLSIGDVVVVVASRTEMRKTVRVKVNVTIAGILPSEVLPRPSIIASSALDQDIENFRAGIAVPRRGWPAVRNTPRQTFQSIFIATPRALENPEQREISLGVGAVSFDEIYSTSSGPEKLFKILGVPNSMKKERLLKLRKGVSHIYRIQNSLNAKGYPRPYSARDLVDAQERSNHFSGHVIGVNPPMPVTIAEYRLIGLNLDPRIFTGMRSLFYRWRFGPKAKFKSNEEIYVSKSFAASVEQESMANFQLDSPERQLKLPIKLKEAEVADGYVLVSPALTGMIQRGWELPLAYYPSDHTIVEQSIGFRGFRLVAKRFEDVPNLVKIFADMSLTVKTKSTAIVKLQRLDRSLTFLVLAVGIVALIGGLCVVAANFIASVKRKSLDYATYRLIGVSKAQVFRIPVFQSIIIAIVSFMFSIIIFFIVSTMINHYVANLIDFPGQLSKLSVEHFFIIAIMVFVGSICASFLAAREATEIDPSLALRKIG